MVASKRSNKAEIKVPHLVIIASYMKRQKCFGVLNRKKKKMGSSTAGKTSMMKRYSWLVQVCASFCVEVGGK